MSIKILDSNKASNGITLEGDGEALAIIDPEFGNSIVLHGNITDEVQRRVHVLLYEWGENFNTTLEQRRVIWNESK